MAENEEEYSLYITFQGCYYLFKIYFEPGIPKV